MYTLDDKLLKSIDNYYEKCKILADYITDNPEISNCEELATARYISFLEENGYEVESPLCNVPRSFRATHKKNKNNSKPRAAFLAEYDALPNYGHACGHSISGAASLLAFMAINDAYPDLAINIDLIGTPGEEFGGGKVLLNDAHALDDYEYAIMAHLANYNATGFPVLACNDRVITFKGRSSHASAAPEKGLNALNAARLFMDALDMWRQHLPKDNQIHGIVRKGGELPSIVPDDVELQYYFRAKTMRSLDELIEKVNISLDGASIATGCTYTAVQEYLTYADLSNPPHGCALLEEIFEAMQLPVTPLGDPNGSTDAGNLDYTIPVFHPMVNTTKDGLTPLHHPDFAAYMKQKEGYEALKNSAILVASFGMRMANEPQSLAQIKKWHKEYRLATA